MKQLLELYRAFIKIGAVTFGGGYAMLPIIQRDIVEKRGWATKEEIADYYAIGQCTPGIIAINTATFVGYKQKGVAGGIVATLGFVTPALFIITIIAALLSNFAHLPIVQNAFAGNPCLRMHTDTQRSYKSLEKFCYRCAVAHNIPCCSGAFNIFFDFPCNNGRNSRHSRDNNKYNKTQRKSSKRCCASRQLRWRKMTKLTLRLLQKEKGGCR